MCAKQLLQAPRKFDTLRFPDDCKIAIDTFSVTFITTKARKTKAYWVVCCTIKEKKSRCSSDRSTEALKSFYIYFGIRGENFSHSGEI